MSLCLAVCGLLQAQEPVVIQMSKAEFLQKVMNYEQNPNKWVFLGDKPCIIDFYADWCRPCKIASPIIEDLAKEYKGKIDFYKVNTDREQSLAAAFGIKSIPAFLYCPLNDNPQMSAGIAQSPEADRCAPPILNLARTTEEAWKHPNADGRMLLLGLVSGG